MLEALEYRHKTVPVSLFFGDLIIEHHSLILTNHEMLRNKNAQASDVMYGHAASPISDAWAEKFESLERINSIRETNEIFDSCNSCIRLGTSRLHELH